MLDLLYLIPVALSFTPQMLWYAINLEERLVKRNVLVKVDGLTLTTQGVTSSFLALVVCGFFGFPIATAAGVGVAVSAALLASHIDWKTCVIPNELMVYSFFASMLVVPMFYNPEGWLNIAFTVATLIIAGIVTNLITKGKLGGGDIKLLITFAPVLYWFDSINIFYILVAALPLQLIARIIWKKGKPGSHGAPYGPALTISFILLIIVGAFTSNPIIE